MSSPFVVTTGGAEPCLPGRCAPFYIREPETMLVMTLILVATLYVMGCACRDYFTASPDLGNSAPTAQELKQNPVMAAGALAQYMPTGNNNQFAGQRSDMPDNEIVAQEGFMSINNMKEVVKRGLSHRLQGASVSKFMDFEKVDNVASDEGATAAATSPMLGVSDDVLEQSIRAPESMSVVNSSDNSGSNYAISDTFDEPVPQNASWVSY